MCTSPAMVRSDKISGGRSFVLRSAGLPEAIGALLFLLGLGIPMWIALRAKPLGPFAYRWGVYTGIEIAITSVALFLFAFSALTSGRGLGGSVLAALGVIASAAAIGTLRRKRWGAVLSIATLALLIAVPLLIGDQISFTPQGQ